MYKIYNKKLKLRDPVGKNWGVFSSRYSKNLIHSWTETRHLFSKLEHFSSIFKKGQGRTVLSSSTYCAPIYGKVDLVNNIS